MQRTALILVAWSILCRLLSAQRTAVIDDKLLEQLLQQAPDAETAKRAKLKDADAIFDIARLAKDKELSNRVLHILADYQEQPHAMSQIALAFHYYKNRKDKHTALKYLIQASEGQDDRTSQLALHNAGQIASELGLWTTALSNSRRAATFQPAVDPKVASASKKQWEDISKSISAQALSIEHVGELFMLAHIDGFPDEHGHEAKLWTTGIEAMKRFNETFTASAGRYIDIEALETAASNFRATWESSKADVSKLQLHLLLTQLNFGLAFLAGFKDSYLPMAAAHAEILARTPYCYGLFDSKGGIDSPCFNEAAASAVNYYRLARDMEGAKRAMELGTSHPDASTHWNTISQTPRVFYPSLTSKPFWEVKDFQIAVALQSAYVKQRDKLTGELEILKSISTVLPAAKDALEIDPAGEVIKPTQPSFVLERTISTPSKIIRMDESNVANNESGGSVDVLHLFNGLKWNQDACESLPTLCRAIQKHERRLCSEGSTDIATVHQLCGSDSVVHIIRLRSGVRILPRNGESNNHLTLYTCLEGCAGMELSVNGATITDFAKGTGRPIIFDDSL